VPAGGLTEQSRAGREGLACAPVRGPTEQSGEGGAGLREDFSRWLVRSKNRTETHLRDYSHVKREEKERCASVEEQSARVQGYSSSQNDSVFIKNILFHRITSLCIFSIKC
jgi:hypothetical protein